MESLMQRITALQEQVGTWRGLHQQARDLADLLELADAEDNAEVVAEVEREMRALLSKLPP